MKWAFSEFFCYIYPPSQANKYHDILTSDVWNNIWQDEVWQKAQRQSVKRWWRHIESIHSIVIHFEGGWAWVGSLAMWCLIVCVWKWTLSQPVRFVLSLSVPALIIARCWRRKWCRNVGRLCSLPPPSSLSLPQMSWKGGQSQPLWLSNCPAPEEQLSAEQTACYP